MTDLHPHRVHTMGMKIGTRSLTHPRNGDVIRAERREHLRDLLYEISEAGRDVLIDGETADLQGVSTPLVQQERLDSQRHSARSC